LLKVTYFKLKTKNRK